MNKIRCVIDIYSQTRFVRTVGTGSTDSQVPEILVVVQVFVVDGGEAALVDNVAVRRNKRGSGGSHLFNRDGANARAFQPDKSSIITSCNWNLQWEKRH